MFIHLQAQFVGRLLRIETGSPRTRDKRHDPPFFCHHLTAVGGTVAEADSSLGIAQASASGIVLSLIRYRCRAWQPSTCSASKALDACSHFESPPDDIPPNGKQQASESTMLEFLRHTLHSCCSCLHKVQSCPLLLLASWPLHVSGWRAADIPTELEPSHSINSENQTFKPQPGRGVF